MRQRRWDHLGVGRDLGAYRQVPCDLDVCIVVDVAIQRADRVGEVTRAGACDLIRVQRVRIRLADDADTRPPRVTKHHHLSVGTGQRVGQQVIFGDRCTDCTHVVAQLTDLGGGFVDDAQGTIGSLAYRTVAEQRIGRTVCQAPTVGLG